MRVGKMSEGAEKDCLEVSRIRYKSGKKGWIK